MEEGGVNLLVYGIMSIAIETRSENDCSVFFLQCLLILRNKSCRTLERVKIVTQTQNELMNTINSLYDYTFLGLKNI